MGVGQHGPETQLISHYQGKMARESMVRQTAVRHGVRRKEVFMMRRNAAPFWLGFTLLLLMLPAAAMSQRRTALVIGNATYEREPLRTPINDATDIAKTLEQLGFVVSLLHNVPQQAMEQALVVFGQQLRQHDLGLFYFAGRGVHVYGEH